MSGCDAQLLSAYVDGELDAAARQRVEQHVACCAACAEEIRSLRETSRLLKNYPFADIDGDELARAHEVIDAAVDQPVLRLGFTLGALAASVLIVSCAWLMELPKAAAPTPNPSPEVASTPQWERMATTLRAEPFRSMNGDTAMMTTDSKLADWMLNRLDAKNTDAENAN
jgi:anti-sigma factor RsiW